MNLIKFYKSVNVQFRDRNLIFHTVRLAFMLELRMASKLLFHQYSLIHLFIH